jgi:DNA-binding NarL/FixJ family response regulator
MPPLVRIAYSVERRIPACLLLVAAEIDVANMVYGTLERALGSRVCVLHEPTLEPALKLLAVCRFRLILLDLSLHTGSRGSALRALKRAAPDTPLVLLASRANTALDIERAGLGDAEGRLAGAVAVVPRGEPERLVRVVREVLGMPARSS